MNSRHHERFMEVCLHLAEKGRGLVSPNPLVGAVLVRANRIVAQGYHRRFGGPHAEVECLRRYSGHPGSTTLYVNLEPCTYFGKTPPCTDLIIRSGIKTVVVGMKDPNPRVNGSGIRRLRTSGITVVPGILEGNARALNRAFITYVTKARPLVHVKIAQSLDGKIAQRLNSSTRVTGREAERLVHRMRSEHDAILVGAGTVRVDNPLLNVRLVKGIDPAAVVIDGRLSVGVERRLWRTARHRRVLLLTSPRSIRNHANKVKELCSADHRHWTRRLSADHGDQHDHLLRADHLPIGWFWLGGAVDSGDGRRGRRERADDACVDEAVGPYRAEAFVAYGH